MPCVVSLAFFIFPRIFSRGIPQHINISKREKNARKLPKARIMRNKGNFYFNAKYLFLNLIQQKPRHINEF